MKKKDIMFLCQYFYPEYVSSATLPFDTAVALKKAGYTVDVLCGYPQEYATSAKIPVKETVEGIQIHRVKYLQMDRKGFLGRLINYFSFTFAMALRLFCIAKYRSVIVYSNPPILPWVASWAKMLFGTKLVFVTYDLYPEIAVRTGMIREGNMICRLMDHINKCVYRRADYVIALSTEMRNYIAQERPIEPDRIVVIHNWYEDQGERKTIREDNCFKALIAGRFAVSYFGNMGTAQDMDTILGAIRLLKNDDRIAFLFAGHGNKLMYVKQVVTEEGIRNAYIYDFLHGQDFQDALQISDCALISLAEGLTGLCVPSKTYSYMMQGLPLLAVMDDCDIVSDIETGAGFWVHNGESKELAAHILEMQASPNKVRSMAETCRGIYLQKYTTEIGVNQYVSVFERLLRD